MTLAMAEAIIEGAMARAAELGTAPMAMLVLDTGGFPICYKRQDGSSNLRYAIAEGKAWGALGLGISSRAVGEIAARSPTFINSMAAASGGRVVGGAGGVLVRDAAGALIGAVGVTGDTSDRDEDCALAGIRAAGLSVQD